ncbi:hypothetical protein [Mangrovicoccus ximenensis]|uniref:hypothetical protein n=1 Tax=Mangrovicoccus ximenensis TaxID=1911570 RepID=UPI00137523EE|nr:hypothetical protein [Mangrovicoccus ximenensis]
MDWLTKFKGVIDCANRTVTLTNEKGETVVYKSLVSPPSSASASAPCLVSFEPCASSLLRSSSRRAFAASSCARGREGEDERAPGAGRLGEGLEPEGFAQADEGLGAKVEHFY